jgi:hypothetical protein
MCRASHCVHPGGMMSEENVLVGEKGQPDKQTRRPPRNGRPNSAAAALKAKNVPTHTYSAKRKKGLSPVYIVGNAVALVVIVMLVLFAWAKEGSPPPTPVVSEPTPVVEEATVPVTSDDAGPEVNMIDPSMPQGVVTVPKIGLRHDHSFNAKIMKVNVHRGDRLGIIKRYAPSAGPGWLLVRTAPGSVGWIVASVVRESQVRG